MDFDIFQNGQWQNLLYLSLLLAFLLSSTKTRSRFFSSKSLKYLGIWSGIILIFVILFSYRFEFSDFKNRILGEISPGSARSSEDGKIIINISKDGHFYLNAKINNQKIRFMIDTGASDITLSKSDARKVGINLRNLKFNKPYQTANGVTFGAKVMLKELEIAGQRFYKVSASINSSSMGTSLLGMSFLREFNKYQFYQDKLILEP